MLEEQLIQTSGFRNVGPEGARTGFQLRVRSPYYRGLWANLIEKPTVTVDGERFGGDDIRWTLPTGHDSVAEFSFAELQESPDARWPLGHAAVLTVPRAGGLARGIHDVALELRLRMSYIPEELQPSIWTASRKAVIVL
ncbi:DUF6379 domain-containing protein [Leifsonia sp. EB34]|uniref:C-glycoside deglycosidase beta subunit domain-containing protein n=1 Tax=Leifsonia sp. EB34 TaxID=3156303 RepID=UPI003514C7F2